MKRENFINDVREGPILYMCAVDENISPGARYGPVVRDIYIVECCTEGFGSVIINDREFFFGAGDAYIVAPGQKVVHTADETSPRRGVWCAIDGLIVSKTVADVGITPESPFIDADLFDEVTNVINQMIEIKNDTDLGADLRRTGLIYALLGALTRKKPAGDKNIWIDKAIGFMETNYHKDISVDDIACGIGLERCYFSTLFKSRTGISPHLYLSNLRVKKASTLMRDKAYTVADAAESVGLDPQNFARLFRKITGMNPKDFKNQK